MDPPVANLRVFDRTMAVPHPLRRGSLFPWNRSVTSRRKEWGTHGHFSATLSEDWKIWGKGGAHPGARRPRQALEDDSSTSPSSGDRSSATKQASVPVEACCRMRQGS